jgi:lipid A 3-O-deacylase
MTLVFIRMSLPILAAAWLVSPVVAADDEGDPGQRASLEIHFATTLAVADAAWLEDPPAEPVRLKPAFGKKDSWRWHLSVGYGREVETNWDQNVLFGGGVNYFIIDNLSLIMELNVLWFDQTSEPGLPPAYNAWGINFNLLARWHFIAADTWSIYADGGAGVLATTEPVPGPDTRNNLGGTTFNFTPQIGFGGSFEIAENTRLLLGLRFHHISNAQSEHNNPGRNSLMFYVEASFPF